MIKIVGVSGSLREGSLNSALLRAAAGVMPEGSELVIGTIEGIPLYNGDLEDNEGIPKAVETLKTLIAGADGLLISTPEYNNSVPGVLKNAMDWLSRPPADSPKVYRGRPVAVIGASPSGFGTLLAQNAWLPVLRALGTRPWFGGRLTVSRAHTAFDESGALTDEAIKTQLTEFMSGFVAFTRAPAS